MISSKELTGVPNANIEIVKAPEYGTVVVQDNGSIVYTSSVTDPKSTVIDVVEYKFTNLSGAVIIARKEFLISQEGDVPRIIQTGEDSLTKPSTLGVLVLLSIVLVSFFSYAKRIRRER